MARETRQVWAKRVERWLDSGLTAKEFAAEIGVNPNTLAHWRWRLGEEAEPPEPTTSADTAVPPFVEVIAAATSRAGPTVEAEAGPAGDEPLELVLAGGHRLRIPVHFDPGSLRRVLAVLEVR